MVQRHEIDEKDISNYIGLISTKNIMTPEIKKGAMKFYEHLIGCENCMNYYVGLKKEVAEKILILDDTVTFNGICLNSELLLQNEKTIEALFRN